MNRTKAPWHFFLVISVDAHLSCAPCIQGIVRSLHPGRQDILPVQELWRASNSPLEKIRTFKMIPKAEEAFLFKA